MNRKESDYFAKLAECTALGCDAAVVLYQTSLHFKPGSLSGAIPLMEKASQDADSLCLQLAEALMKDFLPPIDREDIYLMSCAAARVTDSLCDAARSLSVFPFSVLRADAIGLSEDAVNCSSALNSLMREFPALHRSGKLSAVFSQLSEYGNCAGKHYTAGLQRLNAQRLPAAEAYLWQNVYSHLKNSCDACKEAAVCITAALLKNS